MILSIDAGTTSIRGFLFDESGNTLFSCQKKTVPVFHPDNRVEQDPLVWRRCLEMIMKETSSYLSERGASLQAIGVTAFRSPVFPIDRKGTPLHNAIMWQDKRTDDLCRTLADKEDLVYRLSGLPVNSVFSAVKMKWLMENEPETMKKSWKLSGVYEYLLFLLTGNFVTDHSVASRTSLFDLKKLEWSEELLDVFSLKREFLADLLPPGSVCGTLSAEWKGMTGISGGIPVIAAGGDQQCAALGLGITGPGMAAVNTGTGAYALCLTDAPCEDPDRAVYTNLSAIPGLYMIEAGILTAGTIYRWFSDTFFSAETASHLRFAIIDSEIDASPPGAKGVILIPRFKESSTGGVFLHLDLGTTRGDMARAMLEGIAFEMKTLLKKLETHTGKMEDILVSGGMTRFPTYNRIQADIFDRPVKNRGDGEATALGSWINTVKALEPDTGYDDILRRLETFESETFTPADQNRELYRKLGQDIDEINRSLNGIDSSQRSSTLISVPPKP